MATNPEDNTPITNEEVKKEFQMERMILFSDAVFAIVITLMAMEIKLPSGITVFSTDSWREIMKYLIPRIFSYAVSFFFIGLIWYQHLKLFSLVRDYDKGLVVRNLLLLFFVGLFPFSTTVITQIKGSIFSIAIYMGIIFLCLFAQYLLLHYILVKRPELRYNVDITEWMEEMQDRKKSVIGFSIVYVLIIFTYIKIEDPNFKPLAMMWVMLFALVHRLMKKKKVKKS